MTTPRALLAAMIASTALAPSVFAQSLPELKVLTYDGFAADWGPGPQIKQAFEAECGCTLTYIPAADTAAILARLQLEGGRSEASLVLGLDTNLSGAATKSGLFVPHGRDAVPHALPVPFEDPLFRPFDWGWFAFVYQKDKLAEAPTSFEALAASDLKVILQDPRSSSPGLGALMWVKAAYGERAGEIWADLADNILTITPSWSEAYGLFLNGEADMVFSYTTSPAYHLIAEGDDTKAAAAFSEGHYLQLELAGILKSAPEPELAQRFLAFMETPAFQEAIPTNNWMYPAYALPEGLPEGYATLLTPETSLLLPPDEAAAIRAEALSEWQAALSR